MTQLVATMHIYDSQRDVVLIVNVHEVAAKGGRLQLVLQRQVAMPGKGLTDPAEWLRDTLDRALQEKRVLRPNA